MTNCKFDPNHRIPASRAAEHMRECAVRREGYTKDEKLLSEPNFVSGSSISLGILLLKDKLLNKTH